MNVAALDELLSNNPVSAELFEHGARASVDSRSGEKIRALAAIVAEGISKGGDALDYSHVLLNAIEPLEDFHVRIMLWIRDLDAAEQARFDVPAKAGRLSIVALQRALPDMSDVAGPLISSLVGQGLVENVAPGRLGGVGESEMWCLTSLGQRILEYLTGENAK